MVTLKQLRVTILIITFGLLCSGAGFWFGTHEIKLKSQNSNLKTNIEVINKAVPADKKVDFSLFWQVWDKLEEKYYDKKALATDKMVYGAIEGLTASLSDPYTVFLPPSNNKQVKEDLNGSFAGIGVQLDYKDGNKLAITAPLKGSPAEAAGVKAGDVILHIKDEKKGIDEDTDNITLPQAVEQIRGDKGTKITLTLERENKEGSFTVDIIRGDIVVPSVEVEFVKDNSIAWLKLTRFGDLTAKQWDESVDKINNNAQVKGVILDLRGNPGGYLSGAVSLASEFLDKGVVVKQENYNGEVETYSVNRHGKLLTIPLVVLIDKGSASASEILAGALQDHGRAKLVGTVSFGKGTIQEAEDLSAGAGLHITTAKWLTPNGTWVHKKGLTPDFVVELDPKNPKDDKQLQKAIDLLSK